MRTDIVFQVVLFRLLFKLSLRDLMQLFLIRGYEFSYETVRDWEARFAPLLADPVRRRRKDKVGRCWHVDETYIKVSGRWCYLYRAIDRDGQLVDLLLSAKRDMAAAQRFFRSAQTVAGRRPEQVTTDGHNSYPRAIAEVLGKRVKHRCSRYKIIESSRIIGASNSAITRCWDLKTFDPRNDSAVPSTNSETTFDPDNVVTKPCRQPEARNNFVRNWIPYNRPSWLEGNHS